MNSNSTTASKKWYLHSTAKLSARLCCNHSVSAINENQMIITGGDDNTSYTNVEIFDSKKGSIVKLADMVEERSEHSSVVLNNYLYVMGGFYATSVHQMDLSKINDDSLKSATTLNLWETGIIPNIDKNRINATAVACNEYIYLFGGRHLVDENNTLRDEFLSSCIRYQPHSSSSSSYPNEKWETISSMKTKRCGHAAVVVVDKIYVMGGYNGESDEYLDSMEIFDPSANKFDDGPSLPIPLDNMIAVSIENYIIVNGGETTDGEINEKTFVLDINQKNWVSINSPSINTPRFCHAATVLQNDTIVVCGGEIGGLDYTDTIEWIRLDELLHGKRWNRRKAFIILRCLVERGRASPANNRYSFRDLTFQESKDTVLRCLVEFCGWRSTMYTKKNIVLHNEKDDFQDLCFRIQMLDDDVFRLVLQFL